MRVEQQSSLQIEQIRSSDELTAIETEWTNLWKRCPIATPFQSPAWLIPWWKHFGNDEDLFAMAIRNAGELAGIAPFYLAGDQANRRSLQVIGTGISDNLDALALPHFASLVADGIFSFLAEACNLWTICEFHDLAADAFLLKAPSADLWQDNVREESVCPILALPKSVEDLPKILPEQDVKSLSITRL